MSIYLQQMLAAPGLNSTAFPENSRYHGIETKVFENTHGDQIVHIKRRIFPLPENFALLHYHAVVQGDRLDNLAQKYLGDSEQFWRLCDANGAIRPNELLDVIGRHLRITLPEGIPGDNNA